MELIDSHTHLDAEPFDMDRQEVIERARAAGVAVLITIGAGYGVDSMHRAVSLAERFPNVWAAVGIHPHDAETPEEALADLSTLARHQRVVAVGETGLDYFKELAPRDLQERWFRAHIRLALEVDKPLIIHSRSAGARCLEILREMGASRCGGVFHCFGEDAAFAAALAEIRFLVSFPGTITFKKAEATREVARRIPLEQIMLETDAPYLAPEPYRGKRCESAMMVATAERLAEIRGLSLDEVARVTTETARRFFRLPREAPACEETHR